MSFPTIAHVVSTYPPYRGGMGNVAHEYVERLRTRGYNVHVFTIAYDDKREDERYIHRIPGLMQIGNASVLPSLFHRLAGFDLVHLHYPFFGGAEPVIVRKALRADQGLVMTYHMDASAGGVKGVLFSAHQRLLFPWLINRVDRILVSSMDYAKHSALAELEVFDRVEEHPFGVDLKRFSIGQIGQHNILRQTLGIESTTPVLIFVGGLDSAHDFKGLSVLFDALSRCTIRDWRLVVVGEGNLRTLYEQEAKTHGLQDRVIFAGNVSDDDLPQYYQMAQIHLFPSTRKAEAFGMVALEAAASGIPTIASDLPGVRTVVQDGDTGLLCPAHDAVALMQAIELLLTKPELCRRFGLSARKRAEQRYHWDPLIDRLEETYQSVIHQQSERVYENLPRF